jgi:hypothetical protein
MKWEKWQPEKVVDAALRSTEKKIGQACALVVRVAKTKLNVMRSNSIRRKQYTTKKGYVRYRLIQSGASEPGEPPRRVTGRLYNSVQYRVVRTRTEVIGVVYSDDKKARRLELGFVGTDSLGRKYNQAPRPWLRPSYQESMGAIRRLVNP